MDNTSGEDLSALAWVHGELRRSLETAHKALRRYLREAEAARGSDVDAVDPSVLRTARSQLHQGVGALELVGMPAVADVLRAAEAAVQRLAARPASFDAAAVDTIERVSFALLDFLGRQLTGKPVSPVMLFPQYRAALQLAAADRIHPADLWKVDWQWRRLPPDLTATPRQADDAARSDMETLVLALMRLGTDHPGHDLLTRMSDLCADLGAGARSDLAERPHAATFWQLAAAVFEAQATGLLVPDVYSKRLASRLMAQLRMRMKGQDEISDRLAQDLLFFCSHARPPAGPGAPRLRDVRQAWRLDTLPTADYDTPRLGRFDPAVMALARKRVAAAKDAWSAVAGAEMHRLHGLAEQFVLVGESLQRLLPAGDLLARALQSAVAQTVAAAAPPPPALAMEVATGILYMDASLEDGEFDHPELASRVQHLARRIDDVRIGAEPQPLDMWMEELYRRVSDRQTMGSVVQELRASLSEIEKQIDQYFRDPSQRQLLIAVPAQLSSMRGVLSVLGLDHASAAALHMRDEVDALVQTEVDPARAVQAGTFDRLADNLGALSFLIDMLAVQPALAKSLFRYDPHTGSFSAVMGQSDRTSAFAAFDDGQPPAGAVADAAAQVPLLEQLQAVADSAALAAVGDQELAHQLEPLVQQAAAAEQPELARLLAGAQRVLAGDGSDDQRVRMRSELAQAVAALAPPAAPALPVSAPVPPPVAAPLRSGASGLEDDAEMRDIFIEEAREVIADATAALERLADEPDHSADMTAVRRAFHTLKGSARMVGLRAFGDAGWACEQLYNASLAQTQRMDAPLRQFSAEALAYMADWTEAIAAGHDGGHDAASVARAADALREHGRHQALVLPAAPARAAGPADRTGASMDDADLDLQHLRFDLPDVGATPLSEPGSAAETETETGFETRAGAGADASDPWPARALEFGGPALQQPRNSAETAAPQPAAATPAVPATGDLPDLDFAFELPSDMAQTMHAAAAADGAASEDGTDGLRWELDLGDMQSADVHSLAAKPGARSDGVAGDDADDEAIGVEDAGAHDADDGIPMSAAQRAPLPPPTSLLDELAQSLRALPDLPLDLPAAGDALRLPALDVDAGADGIGSDDAVADDASTPPLPTVDTLEIDLSDLDAVFATALLPRHDHIALAPDGALPLPLLMPGDAAAAAATQAAAASDAADAAEAAVSAETAEAVAVGFARSAGPAGQAPDQPPELAAPAVSDHLGADASAAAGSHAARDAGEDAGAGTTEDAAFVDADSNDQVKRIGPLRIGIPLFNIYLNEADELSRRLGTELAEWALEAQRHPVPETSVALAHSLAGSSATVGYSALSALARALEHALERSHAQGPGRPDEPALFSDAADDIRRLLHQFAAGFLRPVAPALMQRLAAHERWATLGEAAGASAEADAQADAQADAENRSEDGAGDNFTDQIPGKPAAGEHGRGGSDTDGEPGWDAFAGEADSIDAELFPIFEEEADELLPQLHQRLRDWASQPAEQDAAMACMRTLHTVKGGARLAGAMRLGEMAHRLEALIEPLAAQAGGAAGSTIDALLARADAMSAEFDRLRQRQHASSTAPPTAPALPATAPVVSPLDAVDDVAADVDADLAPVDDAMAIPVAEVVGDPFEDPFKDPFADPFADDVADDVAAADASPPSAANIDTGAAPSAPLEAEAPAAGATGAAPVAPDAPPVPAAARPLAPPRPAAPAAPVPPVRIRWQRFAQTADAPATPSLPAEPAAAAAGVISGAVVRVRAGLLDRMVNQAGEVSITRARIDGNVKLLQSSLGELTDSLERMRRQLHDIELQAETQISSRLEAAKVASAAFDPLEMDRFTRFQELTRFLAESVNDVATLQRSLQRTLQNTEDELAGQARLTRELQDDLLRTRMVDFDSMADRLHRTARQAARDSGKQVKLDIVGGAIEIDRGVLERMAGPFEHLVRNSVAHGVELPELRLQAGKDGGGAVTVTVAQAGNEVAVEFADDGAGLDLARIRRRGIERGLLAHDAEPSDAELSQLIFQPGFSTADSVTELAGRGVGLDVVRAEVNGMGGRIQTSSTPGRGTRFKLLLPLTTAVTQVVMLRCGTQQVAVPSTLIEAVQRTATEDAERAYADGRLAYDGEQVPFYWLGALLRSGARGELPGRTQTVVVIRSAAQRVALHVDEVVGNQEVVVKNVGPQLSRLPGLAGVTLLPSGAVALIYNPVALASLYGDEAHARMRQGDTAPGGSAGAAALDGAGAPRGALVLVVDDSLTVRRVTQRLLVREGYRVVTAKDGLEALERLAEERPVVLLSDIEMPRMDGFDLLRNVRADTRLAGLPVVMITSRIAQKHRDYAAELGVDHYLGKPYAEEELLALVARYAGADVGP